MADMFLELDGIDGESLDGDHEGKIEIHEWTWKLDNPVSFNLNSSESSSKVDVQNINVTKIFDKASKNLVKYCALGMYIPSGRIICRKNDGGKKIEYLKIILKHVLVHCVDWQGHGDDQVLHEVVTLSFGEFRIEYKMQSDSGAAAGPLHFGFDIKTHKEVS